MAHETKIADTKTKPATERRTPNSVQIRYTLLRQEDNNVHLVTSGSIEGSLNCFL